MPTYKYNHPADAYVEALHRIARIKNKPTTTLQLGGLGLMDVPPKIGQLTKLTKLSLSKNRLTIVPPEISQLTRLKYLHLDNNQLTHIPSGIAQLTGLEWLDIRYNPDLPIPLEIASQCNNAQAILGYMEAQRRIKKAKSGFLKRGATKLDLRGLGLTAVPPEIGLLTGLTELYLHNNQLVVVPPEIWQLTALTDLRLDENQLTIVPSEITQLINLRMLDLRDNQLTAISPEVFHLNDLRILGLSRNQLVFIPPAISQLNNLIRLRLNANKLTTLPPEIVQLTNLELLNLNSNQLTDIPSEITQLVNLELLDLSGNQLAVIPAEIVQLKNLTRFYLDNNQLVTIPPEIVQLTNLHVLNLKKNPDLAIPPEIISQSGNAQVILDYIRELNAAPAENIPLNEAKVILVGRGEAGKTSLVKRLVHNSFDPNEKQTDGVNVTPWELAVDRPSQGIVPIALNIWDFGGQEILHATHKFFLTERSLYLIVIEPRQDDYRQQVEYWLSLIHDVAADSPVIIVINKIDLQRLDVDRRGLNKKYPDIIQAFTPVSARTGEGMDDLKTAITAALANMDEVDTPFPPSWMAVKQALAAMKTHRPHMPYHAYETLCTKEGVTDESLQRTLIGFLHRLGVVLNFQDDGRVSGTNVLDPNWISNGVYSILTNPLPQTQKGILNRRQLPLILSAAYKGQHEYVLQMMFKFELAYELELDRESFLIPDLIAEEEPAYTWDDEQAVQFEYQYEVLRRSTLHRLMVRRHKQINPDVVWRTGVMLQKDGLSALIRADIEAKTIRISINGEGNDGSYGSRQFLYALRGEFADIHDSIKGTKPKEAVPVPNHPHIKPISYTHLLNLERLKQPDLQLFDGMDELLSVQQLLDGVSTSTTRQAISKDTYITVEGDYVQGDKAGGDKVGGDKIG